MLLAALAALQIPRKHRPAGIHTTLLQVLYVATTCSIWHLMPPAVAASMLLYCTGSAAYLFWQRSPWSSSFAEWQEVLAIILRVSSCALGGMGTAALLLGGGSHGLDTAALHDHAERGWSQAGAAGYLTLLLSASGAVTMLCQAHAFPMRLM